MTQSPQNSRQQGSLDPKVHPDDAIPLVSQFPDAHPADIISMYEKADHDQDGERLERSHFPNALMLLCATKVAVETPKSDYRAQDTSTFRLLQISDWVAHLLSLHNTGAEVTAVTFEMNDSLSPPMFGFIYSKNKERLTAADAEAADSLRQTLTCAFTDEIDIFSARVASYMSQYAPSWHRDQSLKICSVGPTVVQHFHRFIGEGHQSFPDPENRHDNQITTMAKALAKEPMELLLSMLLRIIAICANSISEIDAEELVELFAYAHLICHGTLYHRVQANIQVPSSKGYAQIFWDILRDLAFFYTGPNMFFEFIRDDKFGPIRPYFQIKGENVDAPHILNKVMEINGLSPMAEQQDWDLSKVPIDFYDLIKARAQTTKTIVPGQRRDWIHQYPQLANWDPSKLPTHETRHCEVKLALHTLTGDHIPDEIVIGVSKRPCWCCELFFSAINNSLAHTHFHLDAGHKKAYPGWQLCGIPEWDRGVLRHVWNYMDCFIQTVEHVEMRDFVPSIMETPLAVWLPAGATAQLRSIKTEQ